MQELRAQIQAQLRLAETLRKMGEHGGGADIANHEHHCYMAVLGLDAASAAELEAIRGNLAKYKGKMGKGFEDIAIAVMDWVRYVGYERKRNKAEQNQKGTLSPAGV